jgi:Tol biopolymer transport system component
MKSILYLIIGLFCVVILMSLSNSCHNQKFSTDYFGQVPPGKSPKVFAPQIISLENRFESRGTFSPEGKSFYFTITNSNFTSQKIFFTEFIDGNWSTPDTAAFSQKFNNHEPFFSYDGQKLYFSSDRDKDTLQNRRDLFVTERQNGIWTEPSKLKKPVNSDHVELFFDQSRNGTIYFTSDRPGGIGQWDIYFANQKNGIYEKLENIGSPINKMYAWDPCIAPDESFLIFSAGREDGYGQSDLYVSFKKNGAWTDPKNLGDQINTKGNDFGPFLSPDNKYLFFCRHDGIKGDIYWVDLNVINSFKD